MNISISVRATRRILACIVATAITITGAASMVSAAPATTAKTAKNVIMLIPDGMSVGATTLARYMLEDNEKGTQKLYMDGYVTGLSTTTWAGGPITDSAPGGTALAVGKKSVTGALGVDQNLKPRASVLEAAQKQGKATGLIATSEFMHATPAAFSAHEEARGSYANITEQMLNQGIDVILGAGSTQSKIENLKILEAAKKDGYSVVGTKSAMNKSTARKLWGDFTNAQGSKNNLSYDIDREDTEPSLADMTKKAIEVLNKDKDGFFLMVEGSKIDWAAHANDTVGIITDVLAFDEAFKASVEFAKKDKNTVVVAVTDHGNSGITIGSYDLQGYDSAKFSILDPLKGATKTAEGALALIPATGATDNDLNNALKAYGITPDDKEIATEIKAFKDKPSTETLVKTMNKKAYIGYTTNGHTGEDVVLYNYAPSHLKKLTGSVDNTDVAKYMATVMGLNLDTTTKDLFVDVTKKAGATIDKDKAELTLKGKTKTVTIKANTDTAYINGKAVDLKGEVAVYIDGKFYVPSSVVKLVY